MYFQSDLKKHVDPDQMALSVFSIFKRSQMVENVKYSVWPGAIYIYIFLKLFLLLANDLDQKQKDHAKIKKLSVTIIASNMRTYKKLTAHRGYRILKSPSANFYLKCFIF